MLSAHIDGELRRAFLTPFVLHLQRLILQCFPNILVLFREVADNSVVAVVGQILDSLAFSLIEAVVGDEIRKLPFWLFEEFFLGLFLHLGGCFGLNKGTK